MRHAYLSVLLMVFSAVAAFAMARPVDIGKLDGETLMFTVFWSGVPAAEAALCAEMTGPGRMRFTTTARSFSVAGLFYPLNSRIDSEVMIPGIRPTVFKKGGREGWGRQYERRVEFDLEAGRTLYYRNEDLRKTMDVPMDVQDPLSCFYLYRTVPIEGDATVNLKVGDGSKVIDSYVKIIGRETVTVPAGTFRTIIIEPSMEGVGGIFAKSPGAKLHLWLTDDEWRRPVKMYSEVKVGSFTAVLDRIGPKGLCSQKRGPELVEIPE